MTQWLLRRTRPAEVASRSPANLKPGDLQIPFDGPFVTRVTLVVMLYQEAVWLLLVHRV
jgi:hypothetical protein